MFSKTSFGPAFIIREPPVKVDVHSLRSSFCHFSKLLIDQLVSCCSNRSLLQDKLLRQGQAESICSTMYHIQHSSLEKAVICCPENLPRWKIYRLSSAPHRLSNTLNIRSRKLRLVAADQQHFNSDQIPNIFNRRRKRAPYAPENGCRGAFCKVEPMAWTSGLYVSPFTLNE